LLGATTSYNHFGPPKVVQQLVTIILSPPRKYQLVAALLQSFAEQHCSSMFFRIPGLRARCKIINWLYL